MGKILKSIEISRKNKKKHRKKCKSKAWDPPGLHSREFWGTLGRRWGPGRFLAFLRCPGARLGHLLGASDFILDSFGEGLGTVLR